MKDERLYWCGFDQSIVSCVYSPLLVSALLFIIVESQTFFCCCVSLTVTTATHQSSTCIEAAFHVVMTCA